MVDEGREQYSKCLKFLETEERAMKEEGYKRQLGESAIMAVEVISGIKFSDGEREKLFALSTEEFRDRKSFPTRSSFSSRFPQMWEDSAYLTTD
ncbi:MAG: hypothetical protein ACYCT2_09305 [Thermoplasmataceae archaeon]